MITASYRIEDGTLTLRLRGHAGSAPAGKDLLCAASTALIYTLAQNITDAADKLENQPVIDIREGAAKVSCTPKKLYLPGILVVYQTILTGFEVLAANYPQNFQVITRGTPCEK